MATHKKPKTSKKKTVEKKGIKIQALISKDLHLSGRKKKALSQALKAAGETFVDRLRTKGEIVVTANDEPFF